MKFIEQIRDVFDSIPEKGVNGITTRIGSISGLITFLFGYFSNIYEMIIILGFIVTMDFVFGLSAQIKIKGFNHILSDKIGDTILKYFIYSILILILYLLEKPITDTKILALTVFSIIGLSEIISIIANMIILEPKWAVLKLLKKYLTGEIAKKIGVDIDFVDEALEQAEQRNKDSKIQKRQRKIAKKRLKKWKLLRKLDDLKKC